MKYIFLDTEKMNIAAEQVQVFDNNKEKKIGILKRISAKMSITIIAKIPYHSFPSWMYQSGEYPKISKSTLYF